MPAPKPLYIPEWASGLDAAIVEPLAGDKALGWIPGSAPPAEVMNWLQRGYYQWIGYLDTFEQNALTWSDVQTFDNGLIVTAGGFDVIGDSTVVGNLSVTGYAETDGIASTDTIEISTSSDTVPDILMSAIPTIRKLRESMALGGGMGVRTYSGSGVYSIVLNASWNGSGWVADAPNTPSYRLNLSMDGLVLHTHTATSSTPFSDATFSAVATSIPAGGPRAGVLAFTADNVSAFTQTVRYGEVDSSGLTLGPVFASSGNAGLMVHRHITGFAGLGGRVGYNANSASPSPQVLLTLPNAPINYRPSGVDVGQLIPARGPGGTLYQCYLFISNSSPGVVMIEGLQASSGTGQIWLDGVSWRAAD